MTEHVNNLENSFDVQFQLWKEKKKVCKKFRRKKKEEKRQRQDKQEKRQGKDFASRFFPTN